LAVKGEIRRRAEAAAGKPRRPQRLESDEKLVSLALAGSDSAFGELVERYQGRLLRFLVARSSCREDAEDALQDAFVNAFRYLESFDRRWRFSTWLYRIAGRTATRVAARRRDTGDAGRDHAADPLEACIAASRRENLWLTAKRQLSAEAFDAMWLRYAEDMPVSEVARAMARPETWTKVVLLRARRRLAKAMRAQAGIQGEDQA
jgi:RNA polymerase sigma-70 factor, ECF subfamily